MKSNSKQVREQIKQHILDSVYNFEGEQFNDLKSAAQHLNSEFIRVANYPNNLNRFPNNQERFSDYLCGLPFHFLYVNDEIADYLNSLGLNPTGKTFDSDKSMKLYHYLIYSEMQKAL
jgi:hypothetical protein